jgi:hypothetical protein
MTCWTAPFYRGAARSGNERPACFDLPTVDFRRECGAVNATVTTAGPRNGDEKTIGVMREKQHS